MLELKHILPYLQYNLEVILSPKGIFNLDSEYGVPYQVYMPMRITNILLPHDNHNVVEIEINNTNEDWGVGYIELDEILLLLYPISSLTDTHWNLYSRLYGLTKSEILVRDINTLPHGLVNSWIENNIDIFNLIPQGLAKDKTMYKETRNKK